MITPQEKIDLGRAYDKNPATGIIMLLELVKREMAGNIESMKEKAVADLRRDILDMQKIMNDVKGNDGDDADPQEIAEILAGMPEFVRMVKGEDGKSVEIDEITTSLKASASFIASIKGKDGESVEIADVVSSLLSNKRFIKAATPECPTAIEVARELKNMPSFIESTKGEDGDDGDDGSPDKPLEIAEKLNTTEDSVEQYVIKGLVKWMEKIEKTLREMRKSGGSGKTHKHGGGGNIVEYADLTSQCNGVTKTFTIPRCRRVLSVHGTEFPVNYRPIVDWASTQTTLTLTSEVSAPETGQTLYIIYIR